MRESSYQELPACRPGRWGHHSLCVLLLTSLFMPLLSNHSEAQTGGPAEFIGTDTNWFNPSNWSTGRVPDADTDILISATSVVIDPATTGGPVAVRDVFIENGGSLTTLPGTQFSYNILTGSGGGGTFDSQSSEIVGNAILPGGGSTGGTRMWMSSGTRRLNPSTEDLQTFDASAGGTLIMALGGTTPASPGNTGAGHYATLLADDVILGGTLEIELAHGFTPTVGDSFQIITARNTLDGRFANLPEGAPAALFPSATLRISYQGGDGNDVVLTAVSGPAEYIGTDTNWSNPANWSTSEVPDTNTDILISGTSVVIDPATTGGPVAVRDVFIENGGSLTTLPGTQFSYNILTGSGGGGTFDSQSSEIVGNAIVPGSGGAGGTRMWLSSSTRRLNPSTEDLQTIDASAGGTLIMALGGTTPASPGNTGAGHYATLLADDVILGGTLEIELAHGFTPTVGDSFQIITARDTLDGRFANLIEGAPVARFGNVTLQISYQGGDGNDVVLTAVATPAPIAVPLFGAIASGLLAALLGLFGIVGLLRDGLPRSARR